MIYPHATCKFLTICTLTLIGVMCLPAHGQARGKASGRVDQFTQDTMIMTDELISSVVDRESLQDAMRSSFALSDTVSSRAGARQLGAVVRAEASARILLLAFNARNQYPEKFIEQIKDYPMFMNELGLLWVERDNPSEVIRVAMELMSERREQVAKYPALAAAICVVHDMPAGSGYTRRINENNPVGGNPLEIFDFFVSNASTMRIKPDALPALNLVYVVDVSESVNQLQWAHDRYRTNPDIGSRFFEIEYDTEHYRQGKAKKVTQAGNYCLESIQKHGGVCADQAYFAMSVAKACGIPSGYIVAQGADVSHAWVGYLDVKGRRADWDFTAGRYPEYQRLRGNVMNPQTGERISDGRLGILGTIATTDSEKIHASMAAGYIVERMNIQAWQPSSEIELDAKGNARKARTNSTKDRLSFLRLTLTQAAGVTDAWDRVTQMVEAGELDRKQLDVWSRAVMKLAGNAHQDFSYDFLVDLISGVEDPQQQHEMWEWAFGQFRLRPDLAAGIRFQQGQLWAENDKPDMAWIAYQDVLDKFLNDGPMSDSAISAMGKLLSKNGKRDAYLKLLQDTAKKVNRPEQMGDNFAKQSNYYNIHWRIVKELEYHNRNQEAKQIRNMINMPSNE